ncbi:LysR family transcriptional regulator [Pseudomonas sp. CFBP 13710]|uniref:LysR family transcriptional regulator n=1 Tax=Pseudomonas sp. CFBP 13710 TaxID=2775311 RepID=UPI00177E2C99|nr:LysR family transcriptional regulator [Pseudomonas sp. CFBP 13710]
MITDKIVNLDHNQLRAFVTVVDTKSFSRAALRLHRVQSAVSQQIQKLEAQLQVRLFKRDTHGLELTASGERLLSYALRLLEVNDRAVSELTGQRSVRVIRIGTSDVYASSYLSELLRAFLATDTSEVNFEVVTGYGVDIWKLYELGQLDLVLTQACPHHINAELVYTETLAWVCSTASNVASIEPLPLALFTSGCGDRAVALSALDRVRKAYSVGLQSTTYAGILAAIGSGRYVSAVLPSSMTGDYRALGPDDGFPRLGRVGLSLACRSDANSNVLQHFSEIVRSYFKHLEQQKSPLPHLDLP